MNWKGGIWTNTFLHRKMMEIWKFRKRTRDLPMLLQLQVLWQHGWEGGKGSCGWLLRRSHERALLCATCTGTGDGEWWMMWWMNEDAMPLEDFCAPDEMNAFQLLMVMDDLFRLSHGQMRHADLYSQKVTGSSSFSWACLSWPSCPL